MVSTREQRFDQWWETGRLRLPGFERFEREACEAAFEQGWNDSAAHVSDFKRRSLPFLNGERHAYMTGRFLSTCERASAARRAGVARRQHNERLHQGGM